MKKLFSILFALFIGSGAAHAQYISEVYETTDTLQVYFRQNRTELDPLFRDNGERLREFTQLFNTILADSTNLVRSILVVSGASPEGSTTLNRNLSDARAQAVIDYMIENKLVDPTNLEIESRGIDWIGLTHKIEESDLPYRDEVLDILYGPEWITEGGVVTDSRKLRLQSLEDGKVWEEIFDLYFPDLRGTRVMIVWNILRTHRIPRHFSPIAKGEPGVQFPVTGTPIKFPSPPPVRPNLYIALETNLLYDAALVPNIGAEVGVWKGLAVTGDFYHIWWRNRAYTKWYRIESAELGVKYYFNKENRPFKGHHVGVYGNILTYDITRNGIGSLADRWSSGGGISYGYAMPIGRRLNLDFEIGIGYLSGDYHKYKPEDGCRVWFATHSFEWFGPTKAAISLQWLIGHGNYNERRGGRR